MEPDALALRVSFVHSSWVTSKFTAFYEEPVIIAKDVVQAFQGTYLRLA